MLLVLGRLGESILVAAGMFWSVAWSLVLGFAISGAVQTLISNQRMRRLLGRDRPREVAIATLFGAASSSCSYASAAVTRSIFSKGAALIPALAFMFASTNLVVELGIVLWTLMGWQFMLAEWVGGVVLVAIMAVLVKLTYPRALVEHARERARSVQPGMDHDMTATGATTWEKLRDPRFVVILAQHAAMDWSMLWSDLLIGFLIAGVLAVFVPDELWQRLFFAASPGWPQAIGGAVIGPLIAVITFVCSIGNVPMAAILWGGGIGFGGVLAFLYGDLIVLPLLDVYRKYYGLKMAAYIAVIFYFAMVLSAVVMDALFGALHVVPLPHPHAIATLTHFSFDATFWLNLIFGAFAVGLAIVNRRNPMDHGHHHHDHHHDRDDDHEGLAHEHAV
jgi:uncharacterized membrane protein YraQ (UPF0718 family)